MTDTTPIDTEADEAPKKKAPPLWKQVLGACGGAAVALGLYAGYQWGTGHIDIDALTGYLTPPGWRESAVPAREPRREVIAQAEQQQMDHVAEQARAMAELLAKSSSASSAGSAMSGASSAAGAKAAVGINPDFDLDALRNAVNWNDLSGIANNAGEASAEEEEESESSRSGSRWSPSTEVARADALPDSGLPVIGIVGAALGGAYVRRKKRA